MHVEKTRMTSAGNPRRIKDGKNNNTSISDETIGYFFPFWEGVWVVIEIKGMMQEQGKG